ncbi:MAG: hypothetical protein AB1500_07690 [Bacillota bacterium]
MTNIDEINVRFDTEIETLLTKQDELRKQISDNETRARDIDKQREALLYASIIEQAPAAQDQARELRKQAFELVSEADDLQKIINQLEARIRECTRQREAEILDLHKQTFRKKAVERAALAERIADNIHCLAENHVMYRSLAAEMYELSRLCGHRRGDLYSKDILLNTLTAKLQGIIPVQTATVFKDPDVDFASVDREILSYYMRDAKIELPDGWTMPEPTPSRRRLSLAAAEEEVKTANEAN